MSSELQNAVVVPVPEVSAAVEDWLERSATTKPSHGVQPHVTLLWPAPTDEDGIRAALAAVAAFDVEFRELRRFPESEILYLAPEPPDPFVRATEALVERFPGWPPYAGRYDEIVPHLSVAQGDLCDAAEAAIEPLLPLRARTRDAVLLGEVEPRRWAVQARFPFRGG
jgi:2'-5' RNA ligase superfamily